MTPKDTTPPKRAAAAEVPAPQRMTAQQVAGLLGIQLSTWWAYTTRGHGPAARRDDWSGKPYWSKPEIEEWHSSRQGRWGAHRAAKAAAAGEAPPAAKKAPARKGGKAAPKKQ